MDISVTKSFFTASTSGFFALLSYLLGGSDKIIVALGIFMIIDYVTGLIIGLFYERNLSSHRAYKGIFKKIGMLMMIVVAVQVDIVTGNDDFFMRNSIIMILIGVEGISLLENLARMGVPVPKSLARSLEVIANQQEDQEKEKEDKVRELK